MEKIINIDGKDITFKATGSAPLRYKMQFKRDLFADVMKMRGISEKNIESLDLEILYDVSWIFAKIADPTIPPPLEWLDTFNSFPIKEVFPQIQELLIDTMGMTNSKN